MNPRTGGVTIETAIGAAKINPDLLTCAEKLQYEGYLRREEMNVVIARLAEDGIPIKEIVRRTGNSRRLVRQVIRGERNHVFRIRQSSVEAPAGARRNVERRLPQRYRAVATPAGQGLSRLAACCRRVGDPPPPRRARIRPASSEGAVGPDHRAFDDDGPRARQQSDSATMAAIAAGVPNLREA